MDRNDKVETGVSFLISVSIHTLILILLLSVHKDIIIKEPEKIEVIQANFVKIKVKSIKPVSVEKSTENRTTEKKKETGTSNRSLLPIPAKIDINPISQPISNLPVLAMPSIKSKEKNDFEMPLPSPKNDVNKGGTEVGTRIKDRDLTNNIRIVDSGMEKEKENKIAIQLGIPGEKESDKVSIKNYDMDIEGGISDEDISEGTKKDIKIISGEGTLGNIIAGDPVYPEIAKKNGWYGEVILILTIGDDARVKEVFVEQKSGYTVLDDSAKKASYKWKVPIVKNGIQIKGKARAKINFVLK